MVRGWPWSRWGGGDPFGVAMAVFAGGPAVVGEFVVGAAGQGEVVDVGDGVGGVGGAVVGFAEVGGHAAARECAAAVFGTKATVVHPREESLVSRFESCRGHQIYRTIYAARGHFSHRKQCYQTVVSTK